MTSGVPSYAFSASAKIIARDLLRSLLSKEIMLHVKGKSLSFSLL